MRGVICLKLDPSKMDLNKRNPRVDNITIVISEISRKGKEK